MSRSNSNAVDVFRDELHNALCPRDGTADPAKARYHPWMQTAPAAASFALPTESEVAAAGARWAEAQIPGPQFGQRFMAIEFQCYSQNTEDGILLALLAAVGVTNRRAFELAGGGSVGRTTWPTVRLSHAPSSVQPALPKPSLSGVARRLTRFA